MMTQCNYHLTVVMRQGVGQCGGHVVDLLLLLLLLLVVVMMVVMVLDVMRGRR